MKNKNYSQGFSLIELLVAMVVGLIIISGAFSLHSATRKVQRVNEAQMDMSADARFAIETIAYDLRHSGMWGSTNRDGLIDCKSTDTLCTVSTSTGDTPPSTVTDDCAVAGAPVWSYDLTQAVFATDDTAGNPYGSTCIPPAEGYLSGTDVLEVKYADSNSSGAALIDGQMYVRSNFINGRLFVGSTAPRLNASDSSTITSNYMLRAYTYYISNFTDTAGDGIPSLRRAALVNGPAVENQLLISGVVDLQVQFGEDLDDVVDIAGNLSIDAYVDPNQVTDWTKVYAAKIWLVMRGDTQQGVTSVKQFAIAGKPAASYGSDGFRYFMVTSVVNLRNLKQL
ncbi:MAG: PilW family protein [Gammaproteobacteria bacterium]|nr:PilW family protein [Gammaproteobacteria bacterium]